MLSICSTCFFCRFENTPFLSLPLSVLPAPKREGKWPDSSHKEAKGKSQQFWLQNYLLGLLKDLRVAQRQTGDFHSFSELNIEIKKDLQK